MGLFGKRREAKIEKALARELGPQVVKEEKLKVKRKETLEGARKEIEETAESAERTAVLKEIVARFSAERRRLSEKWAKETDPKKKTELKNAFGQIVNMEKAFQKGSWIGKQYKSEVARFLLLPRSLLTEKERNLLNRYDSLQHSVGSEYGKGYRNLAIETLEDRGKFIQAEKQRKTKGEEREELEEVKGALKPVREYEKSVREIFYSNQANRQELETAVAANEELEKARKEAKGGYQSPKTPEEKDEEA